MKVDSSIRSHAWKCLVLLAVVVFTSGAIFPSRLFRSLSRPKSGVALTLGVDKEALRESIMIQCYDTNDTAAVEVMVNEALKDIDGRISDVLRRRMDGLGLDGAMVYTMGRNRIHILLPGMSVIDEDRRCSATFTEVQWALQRTGYLEFRLTHPRNQQLASDLLDSGKVPEGYVASAQGDDFVRAENYHAIAARAGYKARLAAFGNPPQGYQFVLEKGRNGHYRPYYVSRRTELTGEDLVSANVDRDEEGRPVVAFKLSGYGGKLMRKLSRNYIAHGEKNPTDRSRELAIILDGELISAPVLQSEISTRGQISGNFSMSEAKNLANNLNSGTLPVPLKILESAEVGY